MNHIANTAYSIAIAFQNIENELMASMMRNFERHQMEEAEAGLDYNMWQVEQLQAIQEQKRRLTERMGLMWPQIDRAIDDCINGSRILGRKATETEILKAIKKGAKMPKQKPNAAIMQEFFKVNDRKINSLINAIKGELRPATSSILRKWEDGYRRCMWNAHMYMQSGAATYKQAVNMACKDFLREGIKCVVYRNGSRHSVSEYAHMALKTANKRAALIGDGEKRAEWGLHLVYVAGRTSACPKCARFAGRILIDDVYSPATAKDGGEGQYPLLSHAMADGFLHPNCKDTYSTFFEGINKPGKQWTKDELDELEDKYKQAQAKKAKKQREEKNKTVKKLELKE